MVSLHANILAVVVQFALLLKSVNAVRCNSEAETCCVDYALKGPDGTFSDGVNQFCQESKLCPRFSQGPTETGECQSMPNKNRIPSCPEGTYCCIKYLQPSFRGTSSPQALIGLDLTCQAVDTGCPALFEGFDTADCSQHYPNYNVQPVYDCPAGQKCCWTKP